MQSLQRFTIILPKADFTEKVLDVVRNIPRGQTMSYGEVACRSGNSGAARAVGTIMKQNYREDVPCHRVICADGTLGGYNRGGAEKKKKLLEKEGVDIKF